MSINIVKKDLFKEIFTDLMKGIPLAIQWSQISYDGQYLKVTGQSGTYPAVESGVSYQQDASQGSPNKPDRLQAQAVVRSSPDTEWYPFFFEPHKGNYDAFQGFHVEAGTHYVESRNNAIETQTNIDPQDFSVDVTLLIHYEKGVKVDFYVNNQLEASHTTNLSNSPYEIAGAEPNGNTHVCYMKYPYGININI